jgi:hypothetical protein
MSSYRKTGLLFSAVLALLVATIGAQLKNNGERLAPKNSHVRGQVDESQWPTVDYETPLPTDPDKRAKRQARGKKYDKPKVKVEPKATFEQSSTNDHWYISTPALPTAQSYVIAIGEIVNAEAYLSNNKSGVYSEFGVLIERVLKDDSNTITTGNTIDVEREGGRVKLSSGRVTRYSIEGQYMPRVGHRYMLFLSCSNQDQSFHIITGYELSAGKVSPLDRTGELFAPYIDMDEMVFLNQVQDAIINPPQVNSK